jgi:hypothetical protein
MYTKEEMLAVFDVIGFSLGMCIVKRKSDGVRGTLDFTTDPTTPRIYSNFQEA